jgi:hypothetical protein
MILTEKQPGAIMTCNKWDEGYNGFCRSAISNKIRRSKAFDGTDLMNESATERSLQIT